MTTIILTLGIILRLYGMGTELWYDENFTAILARLPLPALITATAADVHPPLYYFFAWLMRPSSALWVTRLPALAFSMLGLATFHRVLVALNVPRRVAHIALFIMAVSPWQLIYASEARMYSLLQFLVLAAVLAVLERRWWMWGAAVAGLLYTHNYGFIYAASIGLMALINNPRHIKPMAIYSLPALLLWLPWGRVMLSQMSTLQAVGYWILPPSMGELMDIYTKLIVANSIQDTWGLATILACTIATLASVVITSKVKPNGWLVVLVMAFAPAAIAIVASLLYRPILLHRALIACSPFVYLLLAHGANALTGAKLSPRLAAAILAVPFFVSVGWYLRVEYSPVESDQITRTAQTIRAGWQAGDVILAINDGGAVNLSAYLPDIPLYLLKECEPFPGSLPPAVRRAMQIPERSLDELHGARLWVITGENPFTPACQNEAARALTANTPAVLIIHDSEYLTGGLYLVQPPAQP